MPPGYAAYEQSFARGKQGPWTDIYGLAATLYRSITGERPPEATERMEEDQLVPATKWGKGKFSAGFLAAIDAGLAVRAKDRPQTIADWRPMFDAAADDAASPPQDKANKKRRFALVA